MPAPRAELSPLIQEHIRDIVTATRGRMVSWDVINEMIHEKDRFKYMPETEAATWFKVARETDPGAKRTLNDYEMLTSRNSPDTIAEFVALAKRLLAASVPINILGIQGHVGRQMRSPPEVLSDLDLLAAPGNVTATTDSAGRVKTRGHLGDYEFTVTAGNKDTRNMRTLTRAGAQVTIQYA